MNYVLHLLPLIYPIPVPVRIYLSGSGSVFGPEYGSILDPNPVHWWKTTLDKFIADWELKPGQTFDSGFSSAPLVIDSYQHFN